MTFLWIWQPLHADVRSAPDVFVEGVTPYKFYFKDGNNCVIPMNWFVVGR